MEISVLKIRKSKSRRKKEQDTWSVRATLEPVTRDEQFSQDPISHNRKLAKVRERGFTEATNALSPNYHSVLRH